MKIHQSQNLSTSRFDLKIQHQDGVESLTTLEEGEFKVPIDGCISVKKVHTGPLNQNQCYSLLIIPVIGAFTSKRAKCAENEAGSS